MKRTHFNSNALMTIGRDACKAFLTYHMNRLILLGDNKNAKEYVFYIITL